MVCSNLNLTEQNSTNLHKHSLQIVESLELQLRYNVIVELLVVLPRNILSWNIHSYSSNTASNCWMWQTLNSLAISRDESLTWDDGLRSSRRATLTEYEHSF
jgi:hypothetical protein